MATGSCNCGRVTFELATRPEDVFVCHCSICRRATGAHGVAVVVVNNEDFKWTSGKEEIRSWKKPDVDWQFWFCGNCGSPVPGVNDEARMFVPAGLLLGDDEPRRVLHHIWVDSKARWHDIGDDGQQHRRGFGD